MEYTVKKLRIDTNNRYLYRKYGHVIMCNPNDRSQLMELIEAINAKMVFPEDVNELAPATS